MGARMAAALKRQNFNITPEQEAEIAWLQDALGASTAKDTLLRAVRITSLISREAKEGRMLMVSLPGEDPRRLLIPELEQSANWWYLVERNHPWRRQMSIKGKRLLASTVWRDMVANGQTFVEAAEEWDIPVAAVQEAVRWCEANRSLIEMEAQEEARQLQGVAIASAR